MMHMQKIRLFRNSQIYRLFCVCTCLSVVNFYLSFNFWTRRNKQKNIMICIYAPWRIPIQIASMNPMGNTQLLWRG